MTPRQSLFAVLAAFAGIGATEGYGLARHVRPSQLVAALMDALVTLAIYLWFRADSNERNYRRTASLGGAIILVSFVAVPYYLYRSRPAGAKGKALLRFVGFCALCYFALVAAALVFLIFLRQA